MTTRDGDLIVDTFAGGGGASLGIEVALGRSPDYAINHDAQAIAMHARNHPETVHFQNDIWGVDPRSVTEGRKIGLLWASPTCTHFSKAKGSALLDRNIRDLAWVVCRWAELPRAEKPRVIILENVEEFRTWGPVGEEGRPIREFAGVTFDEWVRRLQSAGYKVQWRELRACDYGAPTIRKRLFVIMRSDGKRIVWPKPTHGAPDSPGVRSGRLLPWRTAAEIIDWSRPCPSIFDTEAEIMAKYGLRSRRPLADATLRRVARGVRRYVLDAAKPFFVTYGQQGGAVRSAEDPLHTITASAKDTNALVAATMVQTGYGERPGQEPRALDLGAPIGTQVAGGSKHALVAAFLAQHNTGMVGHEVRDPVSTIVGKGCTQGLVAAHLTKFNTGSTGSDLQKPSPTITANSYIKRPGGAAPIGLVAASMAHLRGASTAHGVDEPVRTVTSGGGHSGLIAAFLTKYYGTDQDPRLDEPLHTDTAKPRHGLVTVEVDGKTYAIADIGMRMLTPRERFRAQGFPDSYEIEAGTGPNGEAVPLSLEAQGRMCGNSVCPPLATALVLANCGDMAAESVRVAAE